MDGKIQRVILDDGKVRLHEAVSDSVYVRGTQVASEGKLTDVLDELASAPEPAAPRRVSLLHVSDNHGSLYGLQKMAQLLGDADCDAVMGLSGGDLTSYSYINGYAPVLKVMTDWNAICNGKPILNLKGNHDVADTSIKFDEQACTETFLKPVNNGFVEWGDITGVGGYWHRDITAGGVNLRVIGLDEYEHAVGDPRVGGLYGYTKVYSQAQVDWLFALLASTPSDWYIVMCHHQPQYAQHPESVMNDFVHHGIFGAQIDASHTYTGTMFTYKPGNVDMAAMIVDAYLHRRLLAVSGYPSGVEGVTLTLSADFRSVTPAKFACHLCGHTHGDYCEYHPDYPDQLCLTINTDSTSITTWFNDLVRDSSAANNHILNKVTIDADRDVVRVERIGAKTLDTSLTWIVQDGSVRDYIEFAIPAILPQESTDYYTKAQTDALVATKYTKPAGGIPDTDLASAVQTSLGKADTALQVQVQSDWNEADSDDPAYIANKPTIPAAQVNADWDAVSGVAQILNKPTIPDPSGLQPKRTVQNETIDASYAASFELDATKYHIVGEVEDITVTLPVGVTAVDEFLFTFTCKSGNTDLHLPATADYGNGLDFDTDKAAGRRFQVSIMDGIALYAYVEPASE